MDRKSITILPLVKEQCPTGSQVVMSPSAYVTDETWLKLAPTFAKGARALEVVKDHPDWWMTLTWDGFSYHTIDRANEIFTECKILNIKEEGYYMLLKCVNHMTNKSPRKARVTCE